MKIMDHKLNNLKQVVVEAVDDRGAILTDAISAGASSDLTKDFTTVTEMSFEPLLAYT